MRSSAFFVLFSLILVVDARKDPGEYWRAVMQDQPMPEAIEGLVHDLDHPVGVVPSLSNKKTDCHTSKGGAEKNDQQQEKPYVKDFKPRPNISAYPNDGEKLTEDKSFVTDFEPRPNISAYDQDKIDSAKEKFLADKDFEPRPNISAYHDDTKLAEEHESSFANDFEPRPNISSYHE